MSGEASQQDGPPQQAETRAAEPARPTADRGGLHCLACDYNLTGVCSEEQPSGNCPECGEWFERETLIRLANAPLPGLGWPIGLIFVWPAVAALIVVLALMATAEPLIFLGLTVLGVGGIGQSIYTGRVLARRTLSLRPHQSPSAGSVTLTVVYALLFAATQIVMCFVMFFGGCLCVASSFHP